MGRYFCILLLFFVLISCGQSVGGEKGNYLRLTGRTMGTQYNITYQDGQNRNFREDIDALLKEINGEVSTYIENSAISLFNKKDSFVRYTEAIPEDFLKPGAIPDRPLAGEKAHFAYNILAATKVFDLSGGAFDPTVMPLVNYWGFGYTPGRITGEVDSQKVDSLLGFVGMDKVEMDKGGGLTVQKKVVGVQLDFSGLAKGYGVDALGWMLEEKGIRNYFVEIGGEVRARGKNPSGNFWTIGVSNPNEEAAFSDFQTIVGINDLSVATSGNYRNFYEVDGVKYSHTIHPKKGYPERNTLLSASVFTKNCTYADALATAFMVVGTDRALNLANELPEVEVYLIYGKEDGSLGVKLSDGLERNGNIIFKETQYPLKKK